MVRHFATANSRCRYARLGSVNAPADEKLERAVVHQLEGLASSFPANPRQIKRIVNAITMYWAVIVQRLGRAATVELRLQLAIWIIVMTEWPRSWRTIVTCPEIVDCITSVDPTSALRALSPSVLPGSLAVTEDELQRILGDSRLVGLITGAGSRGQKGLIPVEYHSKLTQVSHREVALTHIC